MKVLIDTNIIIDIINKREQFVEASLTAVQFVFQNCTPCVSSTTITDAVYITKKTYQKSKILKKILKSSYDVKQYLAYLDSYNFNEENEKIVYGCLNTAPFNVSLYIRDESWENLIKYVHNLNLMVTPNLLNYMYENNIFEILNRYRNNIVEITFCDFNQAFKIIIY